MKHVLYINGNANMVDDIERDAEGRIDRFFVVNGGYTMEIVDRNAIAMRGDEPMSCVSIETIEVVEVDTRSNDYMVVIRQADKLRAERAA